MVINPNLCNIIGIDPGNNFGISILTIDSITKDIVAVNTEFYILDHYISPYTTDKVITKLEYINKIVNYLIDNYEPASIAFETAFMNIRFPKAVINLSQYVGTLENSIINKNCFISIFKYAPKYIKSIVSTGDADKNDMLKAIKNIPELSNKIDTTLLTEHEIDAIAIAYTMLKEIRLYPLSLCSI